MVIGYARVSTDGQELTEQVATLRAAGAENIFSEKASGVRSDRKQLAKAIDALAASDVLLVTRLAGAINQRPSQRLGDGL